MPATTPLSEGTTTPTGASSTKAVASSTEAGAPSATAPISLRDRLHTDIPYPVIVTAAWAACALLIAGGVWIMGIPLVIPVTVVVFLCSFVPIVGALFAVPITAMLNAAVRAVQTTPRSQQDQLLAKHPWDHEAMVPAKLPVRSRAPKVTDLVASDKEEQCAPPTVVRTGRRGMLILPVESRRGLAMHAPVC